MDKKTKTIAERRMNLKALLIVIIIIILTVLLLGCTKNINKFDTYKDVSDYCYNRSSDINCSLEKCIMLNSAEFTSEIKFTTEKSYYQCMLLNCKR
jgi:hypothetical protein